MLINAPLVLSQPIIEFGQEVPYELKSIIENNMALLPIVPIKKIRNLGKDSLLSLPSKEKPPLKILSEEDKKAILLSIRSLVRHLEQ